MCAVAPGDRLRRRFPHPVLAGPGRPGAPAGRPECRDAAGADHLYNLAADSREQADLVPDRPELLTGPRTAWESVAAGLLPYPAAWAHPSRKIGSGGR
ncbi:hypothetical protein PV367_29050 [Streptomyces europaeiscabiei]|uniref:Uncharacterized protein n=1 Tax=Streptomyces europaeiscabiei TaxID=146819 RepID=A0AAJ2PUL8_9ACTN|nr:hypothetical protein [Streptomyces europaeiscabiei]MDX3133735.1 hypothetical protein [Streptomyces europaeiscabiei]